MQAGQGQPGRRCLASAAAASLVAIAWRALEQSSSSYCYFSFLRTRKEERQEQPGLRPTTAYVRGSSPLDELPPSPTTTTLTHIARTHASGMVAGGSGITPMYQVACAVLKGPSPFCRTTPLSLVYANVGEDDVLLRKELDDLARMHPNFKVRSFFKNNPTTNRCLNVLEALPSKPHTLS